MIFPQTLDYKDKATHLIEFRDANPKLDKRRFKDKKSFVLSFSVILMKPVHVFHVLFHSASELSHEVRRAGEWLV